MTPQFSDENGSTPRKYSATDSKMIARALLAKLIEMYGIKFEMMSFRISVVSERPMIRDASVNASSRIERT